MPNFQIVDLFCGAGGFSAGFQGAADSYNNFRVLAGVDFNQVCLETYAKNIGAPAIHANLSEIAKGGKRLSQFAKQLNIDSHTPLIVVGGPPCQGFSAHSKKQRNTDDERNSLVAAFSRIAVSLNPEVIVFENVPEVMTEKNWVYFEPMVNSFSKAGYHLTAGVHNTADYGVPQERFRALLVASRIREFSLVPTCTLSEYQTVRKSIGYLPPVQPGSLSDDSMHFCASHRRSTIDVIRQVPKDGGNRPPGIGPRCLEKVDGYRDVYGRLAWDRPAVTITASARNPASGRFSHPEQDRGLTVREAALLQGFPAEYLFSGSFDEKFTQIGNAVPPVFATALAKQLAKHIGLGASNDMAVREKKKTKPKPIPNSFSSSIFAFKRRAVDNNTANHA